LQKTFLKGTSQERLNLAKSLLGKGSSKKDLKGGGDRIKQEKGTPVSIKKNRKRSHRKEVFL